MAKVSIVNLVDHLQSHIFQKRERESGDTSKKREREERISGRMLLIETRCLYFSSKE